MKEKKRFIWDYLNIHPTASREVVYEAFRERFLNDNRDSFKEGRNKYKTAISRWQNQYIEALQYFIPLEDYDEGKCRIIVLKRDKFVCQVCGFIPARIVHHINSRNYYPEYRFDPENLITLCEKCHQKWTDGNK